MFDSGQYLLSCPSLFGSPPRTWEFGVMALELGIRPWISEAQLNMRMSLGAPVSFELAATSQEMYNISTARAHPESESTRHRSEPQSGRRRVEIY